MSVNYPGSQSETPSQCDMLWHRALQFITTNQTEDATWVENDMSYTSDLNYSHHLKLNIH